MSVGHLRGGILADTFSDPTNERIIWLSAAGLLVIGIGLLVFTILWWRRARQEHPALAPLEVMSGRAWAKAPETDRSRRLDQVRLSGAAGAAPEPIVRAEPVDLEALIRSVQGFDDLRDPSAEVAQVDGDAVVADEVVADDVAAADAVADEPAEADATSFAAERPIADEPAVADKSVVEPAPESAPSTPA